MRFRCTGLLLFAGAVALAAFPCGAAGPDRATSPAVSPAERPVEGKLADRIVAWVDETALTLTELEEALAHYRSQGLIPPGPTDEARLRQALERWIDETLLLSAAEKMRVEIPAESLDNRAEAVIRQAEKNQGGPEQLDRFLAGAGQDRAALRGQIRRWTRREWMIAQAVDSRIAVTDADVARFIVERKKEGLPSARYRLSHLFLPVSSGAGPARWNAAEDRARQVIEAVVSGSFGEAAAAYAALHREEGVEGGFLGVVEPGDLKAPLAAAVENLRDGERSSPIRSAAGVHVLYLEHKTTAREMLHARRFEEETSKWARRLRESAAIQIVEPILKDL